MNNPWNVIQELEADNSRLVKEEIVAREASAGTDEFFAGIGMSSSHRTIFIVGDFKQAIFGFQGAAPKIFQEVKKFYRDKVVGIGKKWHEIQLDTCYRCAPEILSLVDAVCNSDEVREAFNLHEESIIHRSISDFGHGMVRFHPLTFEISDDKPEKLSWQILQFL